MTKATRANAAHLEALHEEDAKKRNRPKSIVREENHRARRILAAHLGVPLHTIHYKGGDYLMLDNRQAYAVLQEAPPPESHGAATWYAIQPYYPQPEEHQA